MVLKYTNSVDQKYTDEVSAAAGQFSEPIIIPGWVQKVSVVAVPGGGGSALVQYTLDPEPQVDADPDNADWVDWEAGSVTAKAGYTAKSAITAVRIQAVGQPATLKVAANRIQARR